MITKGKSGRGGARSPCVREGWRLRAPTRGGPPGLRGAFLRDCVGGGEPRAGGCSPGSGQCVHFWAGCVQFWPGYGRMCSVFPAMCSLPGSAAGGGAGSGRPPGAAESGTHKGYPYRIRLMPGADAGTHKGHWDRVPTRGTPTASGGQRSRTCERRWGWRVWYGAALMVDAFGGERP